MASGSPGGRAADPRCDRFARGELHPLEPARERSEGKRRSRTAGRPRLLSPLRHSPPGLRRTLTARTRPAHTLSPTRASQLAPQPPAAPPRPHLSSSPLSDLSPARPRSPCRPASTHRVSSHLLYPSRPSTSSASEARDEAKSSLRCSRTRTTALCSRTGAQRVRPGRLLVDWTSLGGCASSVVPGSRSGRPWPRCRSRAVAPHQQLQPDRALGTAS